MNVDVYSNSGLQAFQDFEIYNKIKELGFG